MTVDEMDLVSQLMDVTPWRPEEYEQARTVLRGAMAESGPRPEAAPLHGRGSSLAGDRRRRSLGTRGKVGIGAGLGAVAAAVAVALVATSAPPPAAPAAAASGTPAAHQSTMAVNARLTSLAAFIKASDKGSLPGNASLVIDKQVIGGRLMQVLYALYTDSGDLYSGGDKASLARAVAHHSNLADDTNAREIAAADYAATGDLPTAVKRMVNALPNDFYDSLAQRKAIWAKGAAAREELAREKGMPEKDLKAYMTMPTGKALQAEIDNWLWTASTIALSWAAGSPQIREGVLRLLSTLPEVTVTDSTTNGKPTLTITAGPAVVGGSGKEVLTVNAKTGIPIGSVESGGGAATSVETDQVSRVTLADLKAGKF